MRAITRLAEPDVISRLGAGWLARFLASGLDRPSSSSTTYRHDHILRDLMASSHHKCFYCETVLKGVRTEIDHHIEIAYNKNLTFVWGNLYLSCPECQSKVPHKTIPINTCLDPCVDDDVTIQQNLGFRFENIYALGDSLIGQRTITKYRLDSQHYDYLRSRELQKFNNELISLMKLLAREVRAASPNEIERLKSYSYVTNAFSLMFKCLIENAHSDILA